MGNLTYWHEGALCENPVWEDAYSRFETPEQERTKFKKRLKRLGITGMPRGIAIAELFCGRGNGLLALQELGFTNICGADLSPALLKQATVDCNLYVADCRNTRFKNGQFDLIVIQGGVHHLPALPGDLEQTLDEVVRILKPETGRLCLVEPWMTPFLFFVHGLSSCSWTRKMWGKLDAFQTMTDQEATTYFNWLGRREESLALIKDRFHPEILQEEMGKLFLLARRK
ncbi:MAG: class I SAM-dependent methyltransferase [Verrucomicrobiota bacterium JB022]|nr:class I SAM-dependent methyltransferase [Verrucomicrobiota bacterium JB022]